MADALAPHPVFPAPRGPVVCIVMDGVGLGAQDHGDAVHLAHTPTLDWLRSLRSSTPLLAHGPAVGMPSNKDMGNSEVGHNALGAGRIFDQGAKLVANAIARGSLFEGEVWREAVARVRESGEPMHLLGLFSDGNVHSHIDHLLALLRRAAQAGVARARVHVLTDGRDVPGRSALGYVDTLEATLGELRDQPASTTGSPAGAGACTSPWTATRPTGPWWSGAGRSTCADEGRRFASAREAIATLYDETPRGRRSVPPRVRDRRRGRARSGPIRGRGRGAAVQLPRRPGPGDLPRVRGGRLHRLRPRTAPRRPLRGHDAVRRRPAAALALPGRPPGDRPHHGRDAGGGRPAPAGPGRDPEVRARDLLLEW